MGERLRQIRRALAGPLQRTSEFASLHETLLLTAVATILVIRTQLWLTHYPQLGGGGLHIAHLLWGGLWMLVAITLLLTFLGRPIRRRAAIVGGIGFGFFIDELGKFITEDNNYFYRPAASLIYLIFVALFFAANWAQRRGGLTSAECVANAIELVGEAARRDLDERERREALALLDRADQADPLVAPLRTLLREVEALPTPAPSRYARAAARGRAFTHRVVEHPRFPAALITVFGIWAFLTFVSAFELVLSVAMDLGGAHPGFVTDNLARLRFANVATLAASVVAAVFVAIAIRHERAGDRLEACHGLERGLLVAILVVQVLAFYESQFGAVFGLAVDLLLLAAVRQIAADAREGEVSPPAGPAPAPAPAVA
ncbi:MAG TPA: hypothetical protein VK506_11770 [Conexibacter sp.]|nr:hypothetical protein [Conexibacter sp.]